MIRNFRKLEPTFVDFIKNPSTRVAIRKTKYSKFYWTKYAI